MGALAIFRASHGSRVCLPLARTPSLESLLRVGTLQRSMLGIHPTWLAAEHDLLAMLSFCLHVMMFR